MTFLSFVKRKKISRQVSVTATTIAEHKKIKKGKRIHSQSLSPLQNISPISNTIALPLNLHVHFTL
jgi:hypothetical protein